MYKFWENVRKYEKFEKMCVWTGARNYRNKFQYIWNYKCEYNGTERLKSEAMEKKTHSANIRPKKAGMCNRRNIRWNGIEGRMH